MRDRVASVQHAGTREQEGPGADGTHPIRARG